MSPAWRWSAIALTGLGLVLRLMFPGEPAAHPSSASLVLEGETYQSAAFPLPTTTPLTVALLRGSIALLPSWIGLTALATVLGLLAAVVAYVFVRQAAGNPGALAAAALFWLGPLLVARDAAGALLSGCTLAALLIAWGLHRVASHRPAAPPLLAGAALAGSLDLALALALLPVVLVQAVRSRRGRGVGIAAAVLLLAPGILSWLVAGPSEAGRALLAWSRIGLFRGSFADVGTLALIASTSRLAEAVVFAFGLAGLLPILEAARRAMGASGPIGIRWPGGAWWVAPPLFAALALSDGVDRTPFWAMLLAALGVTAAPVLVRLLVEPGRGWRRATAVLLAATAAVPFCLPECPVSIPWRWDTRNAPGRLHAALAAQEASAAVPLLADIAAFPPAAVALRDRLVFRWQPGSSLEERPLLGSLGGRLDWHGTIPIPPRITSIVFVQSRASAPPVPFELLEPGLLLRTRALEAALLPIDLLERFPGAPSLAFGMPPVRSDGAGPTIPIRIGPLRDTRDTRPSGR